MVVYKLAFIHNTFQHGGKNRSDQLLEWIHSQHPEAEEWIQAASPNRLVTIVHGLVYFIFYMSFRPFGFDSIRTLGHNYFAARQLIKRYPALSKVYIEGTGYGGACITAYFRKRKIDCYLMPCNIESLVPYEGIWTHQLKVEKRFVQDLKVFKAATIVYCISYTEYWLLLLFGVRAEFLPYQPVGIIKQRCLHVAAQRAITKQEPFLLYLANFGHDANKKAIKAFVEYLHSSDNKFEWRGDIKVAGRSLDDQTAQSFPANMSYEGKVSDDELSDLLIKCEGVILYHYPTTGTVTRLEEYKLMRIPIYANYHATKCVPDATALIYPIAL